MKTLNKIIAGAVLAASTLTGCISTENGRMNTEYSTTTVDTNVLEKEVKNYLNNVKNAILEGDCLYPDWVVEADFKHYMGVYGTRAIAEANGRDNLKALCTIRTMLQRLRGDYRPTICSDIAKQLQEFEKITDLLE